MGASRKSFSVEVAVMMVVVLLGTCASGASAALRVRNDLKDGNVTVSNLPGCCSSCVSGKGRSCPLVCETCKSVLVESGKLVTLNERVGPYPLESLTIHVKGKGYYVQQGDKFTATATFVVGPGSECGLKMNGIDAYVVEGSNTVASICLSD